MKKFIRARIATMNSHHKWAFVGGPTSFFNNSKMADDSHIDFVKCYYLRGASRCTTVGTEMSFVLSSFRAGQAA